MQDQVSTPSNQPTNPIPMTTGPSESVPNAKPMYAWRGWRPCKLHTESEEYAYETVDVIFTERKPLMAKVVYEDIIGACMANKTAVCPMALKMGITKVKRRSGWWWVPPGVRPPTLGATAKDPWADDPPRKK